MDTLIDMYNVMKDAEGVGLSAPQVGIEERFFITIWGEVFVDPFFVDFGPKIKSVEGCLSLDGRWEVDRYSWVKLRDGREYGGRKAIVIQHEQDHLNGRLISDHGILLRA